MISSSERDLLEKARKLDLAALGEIYDQFSPGIYRYAMRLLGDESIAEDCVADTFSRFLHALHTGAGPRDHLQAYLYRIAHNWITDYFRRQAPIFLELDESIKSDEMNLPEKLFEDHIARQQIRIALRCLTPEQMQVIALRFLEEWDLEEIAAAMEKQVGAVKALQHRALESLRRILLRKEITDHETTTAET
jgi:RNA polymerase sigma-70 factor (ECF subfamily)